MWSRFRLQWLFKISPLFLLYHQFLPVSFLDHSYCHTNIIETYKASPILNFFLMSHLYLLFFPILFLFHLYENFSEGLSSDCLYFITACPLSLPPFRLLHSSTALKLLLVMWLGLYVAQSTDHFPMFRVLDLSGFVTVHPFPLIG